MSRQKSSISADMREVTWDEVRDRGLFPSQYRTTRVLQVDQTGTGFDVTWRLRERELGYTMTRRLDDGDAANLEALYGPADRLRFLAANSGGSLVGLATWSHIEWNDVLWLWDIRVADDVRRRGIGAGLLGRLRQEARARKARGIMLETQTSNYGAVQFYLSQGFFLAGLNRYLYTHEDARDVEDGDVALFLAWFCAP